MFDNNFYDREVDVLYLHVGEPSIAVDFDETAEGDALRARRETRRAHDSECTIPLEKDGRIELTLPEQHLMVSDLGEALS